MMLRKWEDLPQEMRTEEVRPYYDLLRKKQGSLLCKRLFDILASLVLLVLLSSHDGTANRTRSYTMLPGVRRHSDGSPNCYSYPY